MDPETPPTSSPLADALVDFDSLGGPAANEPVISTPENDFLAEFNKETPAADTPSPVADTPPPVEEIIKDDIDEIQAPEKAPEKSKADFMLLKQKAKDYKQKFEAAEKLRTEEISTRDTELAELRAKVAEIPELSEKAKFADEAERELAVSRVEGSREFKTAILAPLDAIEAAAEALAKDNEIDFDSVLDAITERDPAKRRELLSDVIAGLNDIDKQEVIGMARDTQALLQKRDSIRERAFEAKKEQEEITKQNETKAQAQARRAYEAQAEVTVSELKKRLPFIPLADGETIDGVYEAMLTKAKATDIASAPLANQAFAAAAAIALPRISKQLLQVQAENKTLLARIAESNGTRPSVRDTAAPAVTDGEDFFGNLGIEDPGKKIKQLR